MVIDKDWTLIVAAAKGAKVFAPRTPFLLVLLMSFVGAVLALEGPKSAAASAAIRPDGEQVSRSPQALDLKPKSMAGALVGMSGQAQAPFLPGAREAGSWMSPPNRDGYHGPRGACEVSKASLCYDLANRRIVYRPARQYMPKFYGLTAESISLRRDAIRFRYSFK